MIFLRLARLYLKNYIGIYNGMGLEVINIDFSKCRHGITVIKGDNGTGKTTISNAMNPLNDPTINFRPGYEAVKLISYLLDDGSVLSIQYISSVSSTGDRKPAHCNIMRTFPNKQPVELNPSGNITTGKDIIYELFNLDDNFMMLSQLSANQKGLGGLKPGDRKRYVNMIIDTLGTYMSMYKMLSKKSGTLKSMISSLATKLSQIGNIEVITDLVTKQQAELKELEEKKNTLVETTARMKAQMDELNRDGDVISRYSEANRIQKQLEYEYSKLPPKKEVEYSEDRLLFLEKEFSKIEAKIESQTEILNGHLSTESKIRDDIRQTTIELESLVDTELAEETKNRIISLKRKVRLYEVAFENIGFKAYSEISSQEYQVAIEALEKINNTIYILGDKYSLKDREIAMKHLDKAYHEEQDTDKLINILQNKVSDITETMKDQLRLHDAASDFSNIPKDCNHIEDCPFITSIVAAQKAILPPDKAKMLEDKKVDLLNQINEVKIEAEKQRQTASCISEVRYLVQFINSMYQIISKFPNTRYLTTIKEIYYHIMQTIPIDIDLDKYKEFSNYISIISGLKADIKVLEKKLEKLTETSKTAAILKNNLERFNKDLEKVLRDKSHVLARITDFKNDKLQINATLQSIRFAKESKAKYDKVTGELTENDKLVIKLRDDCQRVMELSRSYANEKSVLNALAMNDIPNIRNKIEQNKYRMVMFDQYRKDYAEYDKMYTHVQSLRQYTSINGIQTIYMSVFMNSILQSANNLLQLLFGGRFVLQPFVINEDEFRIPCIDDEGKLRPDISLMSDSQLSMISMIISFALLHKASEVYNIIKLDEVDNNLDNDNRLQFSLLVGRIMAILNFHQCIIISHNDEIDLSNADMILFKVQNPATLGSLLNSGANIIYSYHG